VNANTEALHSQHCQTIAVLILYSLIYKLSFWFLNSFGDGRDVRNGHFRFGPSFTKCNMAEKRIYLSEKQLSNFGQIIYLFIYQMLKTARKSINGQPRSSGAFVPSSDSETLLNRKVRVGFFRYVRLPYAKSISQ